VDGKIRAVWKDFPPRILERVGHRPWPPPAAPWIMTQTWHDLLFAHWPLDARELRRHVPPSLELDLFGGQAWIAVVPFRMTNVAPRWMPAVPGVSTLHELNVRTYVTRDGKPGVWFFSLDADSRVAVAAARTLFHLPYFTAEMDLRREGDGVTYRSRRTDARGGPAEFRARYDPAGPIDEPRPGSIEHFLTERYCLYTVDARARTCRLEIHHAPWPLQPATAAIDANTMGAAAGIRLPGMPPLLHFSRRQDMVAWPLERL
jgi:uncharacterized protein YqjF (DUF2071 family)